MNEKNEKKKHPAMAEQTGQRTAKCAEIFGRCLGKRAGHKENSVCVCVCVCVSWKKFLVCVVGFLKNSFHHFAFRLLSTLSAVCRCKQLCFISKTSFFIFPLFMIPS